MAAGAKRVDITSPAYIKVGDAAVALLTGTVTANYGDWKMIKIQTSSPPTFSRRDCGTT